MADTLAVDILAVVHIRLVGRMAVVAAGSARRRSSLVRGVDRWVGGKGRRLGARVGGRWGVGRSPEWALVWRRGFEVGVGC